MNRLTISLISTVLLEVTIAFGQTKLNNGQKKYPINKYLDSLIKNSHLVEIAKIDSYLDTNSLLCEKEKGKIVYEFCLKKNSSQNKYPFAVGGNYPFPSYTTVRYVVNENNRSNTRLLKKGKRLIFFAKAIKTVGTAINTDCLDIVGFVEASEKNIDYIQHTFREYKSNGKVFLYHTAKKPQRDKKHLGRKEHYWIYYENGNIQRETIYVRRFAGWSSVFIGIDPGHARPGRRSHRHLIFLQQRELRINYYETGMVQEKIEIKFKVDRKDNRLLTSDTTKFDITGKIIYQSKNR